MKARQISISFAGTIVISLLVLDGCSRKSEQSNAEAPIEQPVHQEPASYFPEVEEPSPARAGNVAEAPAASVPPPPPVSRETQMLDDAAASNMTARQLATTTRMLRATTPRTPRID